MGRNGDLVSRVVGAQHGDITKQSCAMAKLTGYEYMHMYVNGLVDRL